MRNSWNTQFAVGAVLPQKSTKLFTPNGTSFRPHSDLRLALTICATVGVPTGFSFPVGAVTAGFSFSKPGTRPDLVSASAMRPFGNYAVGKKDGLGFSGLVSRLGNGRACPKAMFDHQTAFFP